MLINIRFDFMSCLILGVGIYLFQSEIDSYPIGWYHISCAHNVWINKNLHLKVQKELVKLVSGNWTFFLSCTFTSGLELKCTTYLTVISLFLDTWGTWKWCTWDWMSLVYFINIIIGLRLCSYWKTVHLSYIFYINVNDPRIQALHFPFIAP